MPFLQRVILSRSREFRRSSEGTNVADVVDAATRSRMMSGIRGSNTRPEMAVRRALYAAGFRFRLHRRDLPGVPDIVLPGRKVAVFVHGCFWHRHVGCRYSKLPATRPEFWTAKLEGNRERDARAVQALQAMGWRVLIIWECAVRDREVLSALPERLAVWIEDDVPIGEISGGTRP
jgi:DNA mismatch endonuclease (patch repair protein)